MLSGLVQKWPNTKLLIKNFWGTNLSVRNQFLNKKNVEINQYFNTTDDSKRGEQLSGKKNISCWESFKWEFKRRLARISNKNEGKKEVSENQKTVIKEKQWFDWQRHCRFVFGIQTQF